METQDILIASIYFVLFLLAGIVIQVLKSQDQRYRYFLPALSLKLIGGLSFALIYKYYYGYGDTFAYYLNSLNLTELLLENPKRGLEILLYFKNDVGSQVATDLGGLNRIINSQNTFLVVKISALANVLSFSNFFGSTLIFSVLSFAGMWIGYLSLANYFNDKRLTFYAAVAFFFIPSIFFWGSGLMKDSLVIGFLGLIIYGLIPIGNLKWPRPQKLLIILISGYIIFVLKAYVLFCLFPALAYWIYLTSRRSMRNVVIRNVIAPIFLLALFVGVILSVSLLGEFTEKYRIDKAFQTAKIYQNFHYTGEATDGRGSSYNLPDYGGDFANAILNIPAAINVTLFRPYPWEINSILVLFAALESFIILVLSIRLLFKKGLKRIWQFVKQEPIFIFILTFTLLFSYVVGFSSYNFGALVRYKIQCMPLHIFMIMAIGYLIPDRKKTRKVSRGKKTRFA